MATADKKAGANAGEEEIKGSGISV